MIHIWFSLSDCPDHGRRLFLSDQAVWTDPLQEFHLNAEVIDPLGAELELVPQSDGLLIRGTIQGRISLLCDRCADPVPYALDTRFDVFESLEGQSEQEEYAERFRQGRQGLELDLAAVLWEQFVLALPVKPLCSSNCRGICPQCGANLNTEECQCARTIFDPRLEVLRHLQVGRE